MAKSLEERYLDFLGDLNLYNSLDRKFDEKDARIGIEYYKKLDKEFGHQFSDKRYDDQYESLIKQNKHSDLEKWLSEIVERAQKEYNSKVSQDILIKMFPSGSLNAQIIAYDEGFLILINECIRELFFDLYGILMRYEYFQNTILTDKQRNTFNKREFIENWSCVLSKYVEHGSYSSNFHDYILAGNLNSLFQGFVNETEYFIIAHEYAHALLKHVRSESKNMVSYQSPVGKVQVNGKTWKEEFEADVLGMGIILERRPTVFNMIAITSTITFFLVDEILTQINERLRKSGFPISIRTDHPPSKDRIEMIMKFVENKKLLEDKYFKIVNVVQEIYSDCKDEIIDSVIGKINPQEYS